MANAPRPGVSKRAKAVATAQQIAVIKYGGEQYRIAWRNLPMRERSVFRKAADGLPIEVFTGDLDAPGAPVIAEDSLFFLWWMARRAGGESMLTAAEAEAEWDRDRFEGIEVELPDEKASDPEA